LALLLEIYRFIIPSKTDIIRMCQCIYLWYF